MTPMIMVAPNGARLMPETHAGVPITDASLIEEGRRCFAAGAQALHAHLRDAEGGHLLDATRYHALVSAFADQVPGLSIQVTSEAAGRYSSEDQIALLNRLHVPWVSLSIREISRDQSVSRLAQFFAALPETLQIQFILYDEADVVQLQALFSEGVLGQRPLDVLYVLGRYTEHRESSPEMLDPFLRAVMRCGLAPCIRSQMVCAFGRQQLDVLCAAAKAGLDLRVGFENGIWRRNGAVASGTAELVSELRDALG